MITGAGTRRGLWPAAVTAVALFALVGCGQAEKDPESASSPTPTVPASQVTVPAGVTLTKPGTTLAFGEHAVVGYEPNTERSSVLDISVDSITRGSIEDFAAYQMEERTKASSVYYVAYTVKNLGTGDVGNAAVPLLAQDSANTLIQPSSFTNDFVKCPSRPLPAPFGANATVKSCLLYLVPDNGQLTAMSFRPSEATRPILWEGAVVEPPAAKPNAPKKATS